ncbi:hypothetical protein DERP_014488 [Dermatophagoides pteronyssinus]|uniref:C2H2-type domain-containing protein n=1 Tax=Dermatophagoides pteronyssinus TaxID=6956 RepID=A0ABQ8IUT0_DERPT|nr:hypothetical protein DERP_014488 [Dermatophagoides pteronyssinus]
MMMNLHDQMEKSTEYCPVIEVEKNMTQMGLIKEVLKRKYQIGDEDLEAKTIKAKQKEIRMNRIMEKNMHRILFENEDGHIDTKQSSLWLRKGNISLQEEGSICKLQDRNDVLTHRPANPFGRPPATTKMSHSLSKYVNYKPSPPQPQRPRPNYFNLSYQQPQSHHQYNQDVLTHRPANPFGRPPYPEQQQYSHANSPWINQNIPSHSDSVQFHQLQQHDNQNNKRQRSNDDDNNDNNEHIRKYFQIVFKCIFCKTIVSTVDDATVHLKDIHKIEQTTIDDDDFDDKTKEEEKSILVESKIDDDFSNKYDQKDCDDGDELTSSQNHFLHDDTDSDLYHERFNNTLSSFSIESENKLDNTIELSSDVEEIEETIVDDHQSAGTIFTLTNNNDDEGKTKKKLTTTIVELNEDFSNEYDQNIENEKSDDLFEATTKSKTTNDPITKNNDNQKTIENFSNDESSSSSTNVPITRNKVNRKTIENFSNDESSSSSTNVPITRNKVNRKTIENFSNDESSSSSTNVPITRNKVNRKTIDNFSNYESSSLSSSSQLIIESSEVEEVEEAIVDDHQSTNDEDNKTKEKSLTTRSNSTIVEFEYDQVPFLAELYRGSNYKNIPPKCKDCFKIFKTVKDLRHLIDCKLKFSHYDVEKAFYTPFHEKVLGRKEEEFLFSKCNFIKLFNIDLQCNYNVNFTWFGINIRIITTLRIGESLKSINFQLCRHLPKGMKRLFRNVEFQLLKNLILNGYLL